MSEADSERRIGRSILALLAGFLFVVILSLGTDLAPARGRPLPLDEPMSDSRWLLATIYRTVYGVVGSYITAWLAPNRPMQHVLLGGAVGMFLATVGRGGELEQGTAVRVHLVSGVLILLAMPQAWFGGFIHRKTQPVT